MNLFLFILKNLIWINLRMDTTVMDQRNNFSSEMVQQTTKMAFLLKYPTWKRCTMPIEIQGPTNCFFVYLFVSFEWSDSNTETSNSEIVFHEKRNNFWLCNWGSHHNFRQQQNMEPTQSTCFLGEMQTVKSNWYFKQTQGFCQQNNKSLMFGFENQNLKSISSKKHYSNFFEIQINFRNVSFQSILCC